MIVQTTTDPREYLAMNALLMLSLPAVPLPDSSVSIKPLQLRSRIFNVLDHLNPHVEDGAISTGADDFVVNAALTSLTLRPKTGKLDLQLTNLGQLLGVQFGESGSTVDAHGTVFFFCTDKWLLAT